MYRLAAAVIQPALVVEGAGRGDFTRLDPKQTKLIKIDLRVNNFINFTMTQNIRTGKKLKNLAEWVITLDLEWISLNFL